MSTSQVNSCATPEMDHKNSPSDSEEMLALINFGKATAADFGITPQSFIPPSPPSSLHKEKSHLAQLKARRRSNIGVRGSPETNSLIRFVAQQRTIRTHGTPKQLVRNSPLLPLVSSTLKQKMATFQSLMGAEESENGSPGGRITTRVDLSDGQIFVFEKENQTPLMDVSPKMKTCLGLSQSCHGQIRDDPPIYFSLEQEDDVPLKHKRPRPREGAKAAAQEFVISSVLSEEEQPKWNAQLWSLAKDQQEVAVELRRLHEPAPDDPTAEFPAQPAAPFHSPSISSLLDMKPTADSLNSPTVKTTKKQVRFGEVLVPELFDKTLPPNTPLQKGGTPARANTPGGALRSLLKTPQQRDCPAPQQDLTISSPSDFGASPTLSMPHRQRMAISEDDDPQITVKIPFSLKEMEIDAIAEESFLNVLPLNLDTAFSEGSPYAETECVAKSAESKSPMDVLPPEPLQQEEQPPQTDAEPQASGTSGRRKRKLPGEESEPVKRSSRTAAKTASGKMKASTAGRRWSKKVDRSLYRTREFASKAPSLSPIKDTPSLEFHFIAEEPLTETSSDPCPEPQPDLRCNGNSASNDPATSVVSQTGDETALYASATPQVSLSFPSGVKHSGVQRTRRLSGSKAMRRAMKAKKVSVNDEQADGTVRKRSREASAFNSTNQEQTEDVESKDAILEVAEEITLANLSETVADVKEEFESQDEVKQTLGEIKVCQGGQHDDDTNHEMEREHGDQRQEEDEMPSTIRESLPPWQGDFNFEDVFKPVPTRGQRSVRRSLRNMSAVVSSRCEAGSTWLPHTSPETIKEARRRTRGRRLSAALPSDETPASENKLIEANSSQ